MFGWIRDNWETIALVGSLILNALGVTGKVPPVATPKGFARLLDADEKLPPTRRDRA